MERLHARGRITPLSQWTDLFIATITLSELLVGVHRSDSRRRPLRQRFIDDLLDQAAVLPFDQAVAVRHAELVAVLRASGLTFGVHDMIIGATAVYYGLELMTLDQRSFPLIPGVKLVVAP